MDTLMWEARSRPGRRTALLTWVQRQALPAVLTAPSCLDASVYLGGQDRVVVIAHTTGPPPRLPDPPEALVLRPAHQWPFQRHAVHLPDDQDGRR